MHKPSTLIIWEETKRQFYFVVPNDLLGEEDLGFLQTAHGRVVNLDIEIAELSQREVAAIVALSFAVGRPVKDRQGPLSMKNKFREYAKGDETSPPLEGVYITRVFRTGWVQLL